MGIVFDDVIHEVEGLFAVAIAVAGQGVPVYFGAGFVTDEVIYIIISDVRGFPVGFG